MLNYVETASSSTILPVDVVPCIQSQERTVTRSYAIGPIDPAQIITLHLHLSDGDECSLLIPVHLPRLILDDPAFRDGYEWNYLTEEEGEDKEWTGSVMQVVNHIYRSLADPRLYRNIDTGEVEPDFLPWETGWLLRDLTRLAEMDRTLAYVGVAHLCFLLALFTQACPSFLLYRNASYRADSLHTRAVKAYRARVRTYREQGKSFQEAQRLALGYEVPQSAFKCVGSDGWPLDM
jgi:hypothetical protein